MYLRHGLAGLVKPASGGPAYTFDPSGLSDGELSAQSSDWTSTFGTLNVTSGLVDVDYPTWTAGRYRCSAAAAQDADGTFEFDFTFNSSNTGNNKFNFHVRFSDDNNRIRLEWDEDGNHGVYKIVGGTTTNITPGSPSWSMNGNGVENTLRVELSGSSIDYILNGGSTNSITESDLSSNTSPGIDMDCFSTSNQATFNGLRRI